MVRRVWLGVVVPGVMVVRDQVRSLEAFSGLTQGPPRFQPLVMLRVTSRPSWLATLRAWR